MTFRKQLFAFPPLGLVAVLHIPSARALRPLASYGRAYDHQQRIYCALTRVQSRSGKCFVRETIDAVYWFVVFLPTRMDTLVLFMPRLLYLFYKPACACISVDVPKGQRLWIEHDLLDLFAVVVYCGLIKMRKPLREQLAMIRKF